MLYVCLVVFTGCTASCGFTWTFWRLCFLSSVDLLPSKLILKSFPRQHCYIHTPNFDRFFISLPRYKQMVHIIMVHFGLIWQNKFLVFNLQKNLFIIFQVRCLTIHWNFTEAFSSSLVHHFIWGENTEKKNDITLDLWKIQGKGWISQNM